MKTEITEKELYVAPEVEIIETVVRVSFVLQARK